MICDRHYSPAGEGRAPEDRVAVAVVDLMYSRRPREGRWQLFGAPALVASLVVSALLVVVAIRDPRYDVLECIALVPLLAAIRLLRPLGALVCGALWGAQLHFGLLQPNFGFATTPVQTLLFVLIPALYAGIASALTGRFGFQPLLLALGWLGPECLLRLLPGEGGLLARGVTSSSALSVGSRFFGWLVFVILIVYVNAKLVAVLGQLRFAPHRGERVRRSAVSCVATSSSTARPQSVRLHPASPRAPPLWFSCHALRDPVTALPRT